MESRHITYEELARINFEQSQELTRLRQIGDQMQSSLSRLHEYIDQNVDYNDLPYEVAGATHEVQSAIQKWTDVRSKSKL